MIVSTATASNRTSPFTIYFSQDPILKILIPLSSEAMTSAPIIQPKIDHFPPAGLVPPIIAAAIISVSAPVPPAIAAEFNLDV